MHDAVVVGGSFGGVAAALALAEAGWAIALVEPRTYLGREMTATLRPWLETGAEWPPTLADYSGDERATVYGEETAYHLDAVKRYLEDRLLAAGVKLIYLTLPMGLLIDDAGHLEGITAGNKSGQQRLRCHTVIDATETALMTRLAGVEVRSPDESPALYHRTLEFDEVGAVEERILPLPASLGLAGDRVILHQGYRGQGHLLVECAMALPSETHTPFDLSLREIAARRQTMAVASYLFNHVAPFRGAYLAAASHELDGPIVGPPVANEHHLSCSELAGNSLSNYASPQTGLCLLNETMPAGRAAGALLRNPATAARVGHSLGRALAKGRGAGQRQPTAGCSARSDDEPGTRPLQPGDNHTTRYSADVLVAGGGTSGAMAAITAAREGVDTLLVEMNPGLGGTGTYGGVHSYWFGRRVGFAAEVIALVDAMHDRLSQERPAGPVPKWNIEAKAQALLEAAVAAGARCLFNALFVRSVVEDGAVRGILVATRLGPLFLEGKITIDATGDGDVAASAGADYVYGSARDHVVMWYSLAQFFRPGRTRNNFTSMVDVRNAEDLTRAILAGRRRGGGRPQGEPLHEHGIYVAPRESRHIRGDVTLTLTDQLLRRCWPDVVHIAFSNHDVKGHSRSDWIRVGLIPPNLEVEIPYRALLPAGLSNALVVGKALSAEHDALPAIRMQPDMENLGGVAGIAAAQAIHASCRLRSLDVATLQRRLVAAGVLPERVLTRELIRLQPSEADAAQRIEQLVNGPPLHTYADMEMNEAFEGRIPLVDLCCAGPHIVPLLEERLKAAGDNQIRLAQALALTGSDAGTAVLLAAVEAELAGERLPERDSRIRYAGMPPDQGAMPEVVYLLHALHLCLSSSTPACTRQRLLSIWQHIVDQLSCVDENDLQSSVKGGFAYVEAICGGAERLGDPSATPILKQLHDYPPFHGQVCHHGFQADYFAERQAYLELLIGRALARCGSADGFVILIEYLGDVRALLAEHAHHELVAISGYNLGKDVARWLAWLEQQETALAPTPWSAAPEPVRSWGETILVEKV